MTEGQRVPALIAALVQVGVEPDVICEAVDRVVEVHLGQSITGGNPLLRDFAFEQTRRLGASS